MIKKLKDKISIFDFFKQETKMKVLVSWIIINILYIFVGSFLVTNQIIIQRHFSYGFIPLGIINYLIGIYILIKKKSKYNITHKTILFIIAFGIIATIFAVKPKVSLFGIGGRYEGLFSIMYYFSLFILSGFVKNSENGINYKKIIINTIIITGVIQVLYAICQIYEVPGVYRMYNRSNSFEFKPEGIFRKVELWATGFTTNPNFFGSYIVICLLYAMGVFISDKKLNEKVETKDKKKDSNKEQKKRVILNVLYGIAIVILFIGLLICNTMSCALAVLLVLGYVFIYSIRNKKIKKFIVICIMLLITTFTVYKLGKTKLIKDIKQTGEETTQVAQGKSDTTFGTNRFYIWKNTLNIVPENLLNGCGIDNFNYAFDGHALVVNHKTVFYDKVHNEYLQILVTEGVFCLLAYLVLYGVVTLKGFKESLKSKEIYLLIPVLGYLIQAFFNISVIEVAPIFFISLGLLWPDNEKEEVIKSKKICKKKSS